MEEKMAGNVRDLNNAFQAAEAGLKDGEQDISNKDPVSNVRVRQLDYAKNDFISNTCIHVSNRDLDGLCAATLVNPPQWLSINSVSYTHLDVYKRQARH